MHCLYTFQLEICIAKLGKMRISKDNCVFGSRIIPQNIVIPQKMEKPSPITALFLSLWYQVASYFRRWLHKISPILLFSYSAPGSLPGIVENDLFSIHTHRERLIVSLITTITKNMPNPAEGFPNIWIWVMVHKFISHLPLMPADCFSFCCCSVAE